MSLQSTKITKNILEEPAPHGTYRDMYQSSVKKAAGRLHIDRTIALVGLMGAGKSTIGRRLSERLGLPFRDTDREVELAAGRPITDIFNDFGEEAFIDGERRVVERLMQDEPMILATGCGTYLDPASRALMNTKAVTIWLQADIDTLVKRTHRREGRPQLGEGDARHCLSVMLDDQSHIFKEAHIIIASNEGPHNKVLEQVITALEDFMNSQAE